MSEQSDKKSTAPTKGWKVSGKDLAIAPIGENVKRKTNTENVIPEGFPIRKDIAPAQKTQQDTSGDLEKGPFSPVETVKERNQKKLEAYS